VGKNQQHVGLQTMGYNSKGSTQKIQITHSLQNASIDLTKLSNNFSGGSKKSASNLHNQVPKAYLNLDVRKTPKGDSSLNIPEGEGSVHNSQPRKRAGQQRYVAESKSQMDVRSTGSNKSMQKQEQAIKTTLPSPKHPFKQTLGPYGTSDIFHVGPRPTGAESRASYEWAG